MWYFVAKHYSVIQKNIPFPHFCTFCAFYFLSSFFVFVAVFWIPFSNFHTIYVMSFPSRGAGCTASSSKQGPRRVKREEDADWGETG